MKIAIESSDELGAILKARAMAEGISMEQYAVKILERHLAENESIILVLPISGQRIALPPKTTALIWEAVRKGRYSGPQEMLEKAIMSMQLDAAP